MTCCRGKNMVIPLSHLKAAGVDESTRQVIDDLALPDRTRVLFLICASLPKTHTIAKASASNVGHSLMVPRALSLAFEIRSASAIATNEVTIARFSLTRGM